MIAFVSRYFIKLIREIRAAHNGKALGRKDFMNIRRKIDRSPRGAKFRP